MNNKWQIKAITDAIEYGEIRSIDSQFSTHLPMAVKRYARVQNNTTGEISSIEIPEYMNNLTVGSVVKLSDLNSGAEYDYNEGVLTSPNFPFGWKPTQSQPFFYPASTFTSLIINNNMPNYNKYIVEDTSELIIELLAVGFDRSDIEVTINGNELSVLATVTEKMKESINSSKIKKINKGLYDLVDINFVHKIDENINREKFKAILKNGILTITFLLEKPIKLIID